eukprot:s11_g11.t1
MKPTAVFISIGRGSCVDEAALLEEPLSPESPLWDMENLLLSPHNADLTPTYMSQTWDIFLQKLTAFRSPGFTSFKDQATAEELAAISDPRERALRRVAKAAHHFAALGFSATEAVTATVASVQKAVEDFERTVGKPDGTSLYTTALGRVKAAAKAVEAMISLDSFGTNQLAELCYVMDDEGGILSQKRAASILGVEPGCGEATAHAQVETRYRAVLSNLAGASPEGAASAWSIMGEVVDAAARPVAQLWAPPPENRGVAAARAMGLRDLKRPRKLVGLEIVSEVVHLEDNSTFCVMLLTEGMCHEPTEFLGISGSTPYILAGPQSGGQGKVLQHPEMNYGPGVSGELRVTHDFGTEKSLQDGEQKAAPEKKRIPGRGDVVSVEERTLDGWQRRKDRIR